MIRPINREKLGRMEPGQDLVTAGYIGELGAAAIAREKETELLNWFTRDYLRRIQTIENPAALPSWEEFRELGATEYEAVEEGGILTALWTLSGTYHRGMSVNLRAIPVRQRTIEICERFELTPYRLWSGNCGVLVTDNGWRLAERLKAKGVYAAVMGRVEAGALKEICYGDETGCMERPRPDEVYRILPDFRWDIENQTVTAPKF